MECSDGAGAVLVGAGLIEVFGVLLVLGRHHVAVF